MVGRNQWKEMTQGSGGNGFPKSRSIQGRTWVSGLGGPTKLVREQGLSLQECAKILPCPFRNALKFNVLLMSSETGDQKVAVSRRRRHRKNGLDLQRRAVRVETLIQMGEFFCTTGVGRSRFGEGGLPHIGIVDTREQATGPSFDALLEKVTAFNLMATFDLDEQWFSRILRSSRRGAAGFSGVTQEYIRFSLDDVRGMQFFTALSSLLAKALVPQVVVELIRVVRLTALTKPDGGVFAIG